MKEVKRGRERYRGELVANKKSITKKDTLARLAKIKIESETSKRNDSEVKVDI
jgi:hypothetical protein